MSDTNNTLPTPPKRILNTGFKKNHLWWQILALISISLFSVYASGAFDQEFSKFMPEKNGSGFDNKQETKWTKWSK